MLWAGDVSGEIHLNGRTVDRDLMMRISGFVPQKDLVITCLTVTEHLNFMVRCARARVHTFTKPPIITSVVVPLAIC